MLSSECGNETGGNSDILVLDDEPVILDLLTAVLHREGYRVTTTRLCEEALNLVSTRSYDLAIADLELRRNDGCRLVTTLGRISPGIPIVAMTAYPASELVAFAEEHVDAFLIKPFGISELLAAVRRALDGRVLRDARGMASMASRESAAMVAASS
jgi:DNA-binding response OmpR family regulator